MSTFSFELAETSSDETGALMTILLVAAGRALVTRAFYPVSKHL